MCVWEKGEEENHNENTYIVFNSKSAHFFVTF